MAPGQGGGEAAPEAGRTPWGLLRYVLPALVGLLLVELRFFATVDQPAVAVRGGGQAYTFVKEPARQGLQHAVQQQGVVPAASRREDGETAANPTEKDLQVVIPDRPRPADQAPSRSETEGGPSGTPKPVPGAQEAVVHPQTQAQAQAQAQAGPDAAVTIFSTDSTPTASFFHRGYLEKHGSMRYGSYVGDATPFYHADDPRLASARWEPLPTTLAEFKHSFCVKHPGPKLFVLKNAMQLESGVLAQFPALDTVMIVTHDEKCGLGFPTGPRGQPKTVKYAGEIETWMPLFAQYFCDRQIRKFGASNIRFMPLGPRMVFPHFEPASLTPIDKRKYLYAFIASDTSGERKLTYRTLKNDTSVPEDERVLVQTHFKKSIVNLDRDEGSYVSPERYAEVVSDSKFVICPRGHSIDQFRIYEAIEAGAIPVVPRDASTTRHLPPAFFDSPILALPVPQFPDGLVAEMRRLAAQPAKLRDRARRLREWYEREVIAKFVRGVEGELAARVAANTGRRNTICTNASIPDVPAAG